MCSASGFVLHSLILGKFSSYGMSLPFSGIFLSAFTAVFGVPQNSASEPLSFNAYIKDLRSEITYCNSLLFADDTKIFLRITAHVCSQVQSV